MQIFGSEGASAGTRLKSLGDQERQCSASQTLIMFLEQGGRQDSAGIRSLPCSHLKRWVNTAFFDSVKPGVAWYVVLASLQ